MLQKFFERAFEIVLVAARIALRDERARTFAIGRGRVEAGARDLPRTARPPVGLDPEQVVLFKQSDVPGHTELTWIFDTITTMPYLMRAHAFKDAEAKSILTRIDKHHPEMKTASAAWRRQHLGALADGSIASHAPPAKAKKAAKKSVKKSAKKSAAKKSTAKKAKKSKAKKKKH